MKKLDTTLFSSGAEFLVLSKLLSARIESYKAYEKQEGYDLLSVNVNKKLSATIQVKSKNFVNDSSFYLNKDDKTKSDFYVFAQTNSIKKINGKNVLVPDDEALPKLYVMDLKTVETHKKIDKRGTPYFLLSSISNIEQYLNKWNQIKDFLEIEY
jgi:hypothetical protein